MNAPDLSFVSTEVGGAAAGQGAALSLRPEAFQAGVPADDLIADALVSYAWVSIPALSFPVVLTRPIVLHSGNRLSVAPETHVTMAPGCGGCLLRNANVRSGRFHAPEYSDPDTDMLVEGGVWEEPDGGQSVNDPNPLMAEFADCLLGVLFFDNAERFTVRNVTVKESRFYGILVNGVRHFLIEDIFFDKHHKDGVHVNGPSGYGVIRRMHGNTGDDFVALNAWDWHHSGVSFGEIHHIYVEDLDCEGDELRLLPGRKVYDDGSKVPCPIYDVAYKNIRNAYCIKLYQQPYYLNDRLKINDKSDIAGTIDRVSFENVGLDALKAEGFGEIGVEALVEMGADCTDISLKNIHVGVDPDTFAKAGLHLVQIGPKSSTYKGGEEDPALWCEIFDTELITTIDGLEIDGAVFDTVPCRDEKTLVTVTRLTPNPDYPRTTPKGGTGYGVLKNLRIK